MTTSRAAHNLTWLALPERHGWNCSAGGFAEHQRLIANTLLSPGSLPLLCIGVAENYGATTLISFLVLARDFGHLRCQACDRLVDIWIKKTIRKCTWNNLQHELAPAIGALPSEVFRASSLTAGMVGGRTGSAPSENKRNCSSRSSCRSTPCKVEQAGVAEPRNYFDLPIACCVLGCRDSKPSSC